MNAAEYLDLQKSITSLLIDKSNGTVDDATMLISGAAQLLTKFAKRGHATKDQVEVACVPLFQYLIANTGGLLAAEIRDNQNPNTQELISAIRTIAACARRGGLWEINQAINEAEALIGDRKTLPEGDELS